MQLTLQATSGPHVGRKILLRSGQLARVGRTEWADFSFPRDADLADVHFAVQCQARSARVRQLAADRPLLVNQQPVQEAELQPGDVVTAGSTTFIVAFDGRAFLLQAAATAAPAVAAAQGGLAATGTPPAEPAAVEIAQHLQMSDDVLAVAATVKNGPELVAALAAQEQFAKAARVQAHLLPKRQAVWWGVLCVEQACGDALPPAEAAAREAAQQWIADPSETRRRACESAAARTKYDGPGSWLAMAAFWSGGSIVPVDLPPVAPDDKLSGQAVTSSLMIAAVFGDPKQSKPRYRAFLAKGLEIAAGTLTLPDPSGAG